MAAIPAEASLMGVPLEIRHIIFEYASIRETKPKNVLRYWFEKKEIKDIIAKHVADNPGGVAPRAAYEVTQEVDSEPEVEPDHIDDVDDGANDDEDDEVDEDEENGNEEDDDEDQENADEDEEPGLDDEDEEMDDQVDEEAEESGIAPTQMTTQSVDVGMSESEAADWEETADSEADELGETAVSRTAEELEEIESSGTEEAQPEADQDGESGMIDGAVDSTTIATTTQPPAPVLSPHSKWRHIPKFLRITQCPPHQTLFLLSKQLNAEAKDWFYNVAVLKIEATGSWQHQSFFELVLQEIAEAAFSPMESIKRVQITFVWDSTWIRAESTGFAASVFPFYLEERANYVVKILQQAPELEQVKIHWYDSGDDDASHDLKNQVLLPFLDLKAQISVEEHLISSDSKPHAKSVAGKRRLEFQGIFDRGIKAF